MLIKSYAISTEYADEGSLYAFLRRSDNDLDLEQILRWARNIAMGNLLLKH